MQWRDGPTEVVRKDRQKAVTVEADARNISVGEATANARRAMADLELPQGYVIDYGGDAEFMEETFGELGQALFRHRTHVHHHRGDPGIVVLCLRHHSHRASVGVIPSMLLSGISISMFALIGLIMLVGLVVNNAIVVIDYAEILRRDEEMPASQAIWKACTTHSGCSSWPFPPSPWCPWPWEQDRAEH